MIAAPPPHRTYAPGSLVRVRNRDWVVLPSDGDDGVLLLRPLGGTDQDATGIVLELEGDQVESTELQPPDPRYPGDEVSARLLREAVRLGFRSAAGPLRSLGRIAVYPRPYQMVPLLMALRQDPVRLLIGDDVGIGKTIEAGVIARELLDRGEIRRLTVLCSPQLCEQWQAELSSKFHIDAEVIRPGTVLGLERRLEREGLFTGTTSLFEVCKFTVVSIDYIKSDRRRAEFLQFCPELVIVDEAHTVAWAGSGAQHQRHELVRELANPERGRHLILATATPHSGNQDAFASLIGLLAPDLQSAVAELDYGGGTEARARLAQHFVQRRRGDILQYLGAKTDFPVRVSPDKDVTYHLSTDYTALIDSVRRYARELVRGARAGSAFQRRVNWWAALALLRCVGSSPAAAAAVLDLDNSDEAASDDSSPGADTTPLDDPASADRARLLELARRAEALAGKFDPKLQRAIELVKELVSSGFKPIVFCRYIATAEYVAQALADAVKGSTVRAVTGTLPPDEREQQVAELGNADKPVLVATDCLSEGINLQHAFDAVIHYDLAWNPTRHEQREGRVDRYGQPSPTVRTVMFYGENNRVDLAVIKVLLSKAVRIRKTLGVAVPVPGDTDAILEAILGRLIDIDVDHRQLELFEAEEQQKLDVLWDEASKREQRTWTVFAQHALKPEEVKSELDEATRAIGGPAELKRFVEDVAQRMNATASISRGELAIDLERLPRAARNRLPNELDGVVQLGFEPATPKGVVYLDRTHPLVEAVSGYLLDTALDEPIHAAACRCGVVRTDAVTERTVLLLLRGRYVISETAAGGGSKPDTKRELLGEEALMAAFRGEPHNPVWLSFDDAERLALEAKPVANVLPQQATQLLEPILDALPVLKSGLNALAAARAGELLAAHKRVRAAAQIRGVTQEVEPKLPLDVLGLYVFVPGSGKTG